MFETSAFLSARSRKGGLNEIQIPANDAGGFERNHASTKDLIVQG
jgi:hypothetical protein